MCLRPIEISRTIAGRKYYESVPCGHCVECLKRRQSEVVVRSIEEARKTGSMVFITLTYSDKHLPTVDYVDEETGYSCKVPTLRREDIKKWKREVRKAYFRDYSRSFPKFSYLICGEYGPKSQKRTGFGRPHYHGVLFGLDRKHCNILKKYWEDNFGFADFKRIPLSVDGRDDIGCVSRYVSKYCVKPAELENPYVVKGIIEKPRKQTSVGFGLPFDIDERKAFWLDGRCQNDWFLTPGQIEKINSRLKYDYNGYKYSIPIYYRKKILYEKGIKGNLVASPLSKVLSRSIRRSIDENAYRELLSLVSGKTFGEGLEVVLKFFSSEDYHREVSEFNGRALLLKDYQRSAF